MLNQQCFTFITIFIALVILFSLLIWNIHMLMSHKFISLAQTSLNTKCVYSLALLSYLIDNSNLTCPKCTQHLVFSHRSTPITAFLFQWVTSLSFPLFSPKTLTSSKRLFFLYHHYPILQEILSAVPSQYIQNFPLPYLLHNYHSGLG